MNRKNIFVICTTHRERRELQRDIFQQDYKIHFHDYDDSMMDKILCRCLDNPPAGFDPQQEINELLKICKLHSIDGVVSAEDYPGSIFASIIARELGLPGPDPQSVLTCHHKYYSRVMQKKYVPEATPDFRLIDPSQFSVKDFDMPYPVFVKPVKSYFSILANIAANQDQIEKIVKTSLPSKLFLQQINWFLARFASYERNADYLLAETLIRGQQVTLEGYVHRGQIEILGIVDSVMYPGTFVFEHFEYPSHLPTSVQKQMAAIAKQCISGIKLDNTLFNIEMMYDPQNDRIHIIEINPRMSNQFADLFEKVDGINTYKILLDLAAGKKPDCSSARAKHKVAASFVLRRFDDKLVLKLPTKEQIAHILRDFPDSRVEIHVEEGQHLHSILQDGKSYRYGLIHLGASSRDELFEKFNHCKELLTFEFA